MSDKPFRLSVKAVIHDSSGRCLLLRRSRESKNNGGQWDLPGGKMDTGETFDVALSREVFEETGLSINLQGLAGSAEAETPDTRVVYVIMERCVESGELRLSSEHDDFCWVNYQGLDNIDMAPQFREFARMYSKEA